MSARLADPTADPTPTEAAAAAIFSTLRMLRENRDLTLSELARRSGVNRGTICQYETGRIHSADLLKTLALADALGCDLVLVPRSWKDED